MSGEMTDDLPWKGIAELGAAMASQAVSPVEVTQAFLDRIERLNPTLTAYISVYPDMALSAARRAEEEIARGDHRGPLHGVPVAVKDIFQAEGMELTCGSPIDKGRISLQDATSVARLKSAGAVLLGKLNLHEFALGPTGTNPHFGSARNPWNPDYCSGGSSSGSGCATAAALAAGTLGTDTGGSIRIPASLCGIVGLKQTYGLASRHGVFPVCGQFDHGGPMTRTVRDAALMLGAIAGEDAHDPSTRGAVVRDYTAGLERGVKGLRIGVPTDYFFDDLHEEVGPLVRRAIDVLAGLGAEIEEVALPFMDEVDPAWNRICLPEAYAIHEQHLSLHSDLMGPDVVRRLHLARKITGADLVTARWTRQRIIAEMNTILEKLDLLVAPSCPAPAVKIDDPTTTVGGREINGEKILGLLTRLAAFTGQPAISVPCGFTRAGLPIGLQLMGRSFDEPVLLRAAYAYEQACDWHARRPPSAP